MKIKIGIPRALLYYDDFIIWETFFKALDCEIILSDKTNKDTMSIGLEYSVDDICLPIKAITGHVLNLIEKEVDYVFLPRVISMKRKTVNCPKIIALPDIIQNALKRKQNIKILSLKIDLYDSDSDSIADSILGESYKEMGLSLECDESKVFLALSKLSEVSGVIRRKRAENKSNSEILKELGFKDMKEPKLPDSENPIRIGMSGHSYLLYDAGSNMDIFKKLRKLGVELITQEMIGDNIIENELKKIVTNKPKELSRMVAWHLGQRTLGATLHFLSEKAYDGVIHLSAFACGPGSMVGKLIELRAKNKGQNPLLQLDFDEHTAETAVITRLEAFVDILTLKREKEQRNN
jgi:predicted nucleotide-binding protein (sugar kinase/HSP70/actin superfamily)